MEEPTCEGCLIRDGATTSIRQIATNQLQEVAEFSSPTRTFWDAPPEALAGWSRPGARAA